MGNTNDKGNTPRRSRVARKQQQKESAKLQPTEVTTTERAVASKESRIAKKQKKKKKKHILLKIFAVLVCLGLVCCIAVGVYVAKVIKDAPPIETDDIYSLLAQTSTIYDSDGKEIEEISGEKKRTVVEISEIPDYVQNAFIAIEDKTFRTHHGFNIIRIFGAIKDKIIHGGQIGGTSTITQQLARNLYLEDTMSVHDYERKIKEAYYAYILEDRLSKDQIMEAYLNTVYFGDGYGIATAAHDYFNKEVKDLTLAEGAALATMPNLPSYYALILKLPSDDLGDFADKVLYTSGEYTYVWNDRCKGRMQTCLAFMLEQGLIDQAQYDEAIGTEIKDIVNPAPEEVSNNSSYYTDFVIDEVAHDFMEQYGLSEEQAYYRVYNGGLNIYTTLDSQAQSILEKEFKVKSNFPYPAYYSTDSNGNIISSTTGKVLLYKYSNFVQDKTYTFRDSEYKKNSDGSVTLIKGKRLRFYATTANGADDISIEMPRMYRFSQSGYFYLVEGAYVNVPQGYYTTDEEGNSVLNPYKSFDSDGNVVISAKYFEDYPKSFKFSDGTLTTKAFTLKTRTIQPQAAMTIVDNKTGSVVAMIGGRGAKGKMLYNRAVNPRQPGSSFKPIAVYSAALQKSYELEAEGKKYDYVETGYDKQGKKLWGDYITAASIVVDEQTTINGKAWPKNSGGGYSGTQTFRTALQKSINTCAVKILSQVGIDYAYQHAEKFGLTTMVGEGDPNDRNLAALGIGGMTKGVTTLEMASAYTVFVNNGVHKSYYCYDRVTDRNDNVIMEPQKTETEVLNPGVAWIMRDVLQTVVSQGIAGNARIYGEIVGGKTGTTGSQRENCDIWFDGFTANYTASLWIGNDVNIGLSEMSPKAASLWSRIMSQIDKAKGGTYSSRPSNVVTATANKRTEYFTKGTDKNIAGGAKYVKVKICTDTGLLATPDCPHTKTKSGYVLTGLKDGEDGDDGEDFGIDIPSTYCYMHNSDPSKYKVAKKYQEKLEKYQKEAEEKAKKEAEEKAAQEEAAKKEAAYQAWLKEREKPEHKHWVVDQAAYTETVHHDAVTEKVDTGEVDANGNPIYEDRVVQEAYDEVIEHKEQGHWVYDEGYKDGQFSYP